jgi:hypothetical protein
MAVQAQLKGWTQMADPPKLTSTQWNIAGFTGVILIVMAVLQLIGFGDFKDWLASMGLDAPAVWAVGLILAELIGALAFFKLPILSGMRLLSGALAVLVAGFWFVQNLRLVSDGASNQLASSGYFGKFLNQAPGWWTVIEATAFLALVVYCVSLTSWRGNR